MVFVIDCCLWLARVEQSKKIIAKLPLFHYQSYDFNILTLLSTELVSCPIRIDYGTDCSPVFCFAFFTWRSLYISNRFYNTLSHSSEFCDKRYSTVLNIMDSITSVYNMSIWDASLLKILEPIKAQFCRLITSEVPKFIKAGWKVSSRLPILVKLSTGKLVSSFCRIHAQPKPGDQRLQDDTLVDAVWPNNVLLQDFMKMASSVRRYLP
jgi:hypothetical protein